ncbi:MAG: FAD-dependent oxidoreductase [Planctomycetales bacterium]|nr:FAD-dependent oxidoreductase [Planctomycetales bacterium]
MASKIVIIGSGVIGTSSAYYLRQQGHDVTVVDRGGYGQMCSHANCGLISPSHLLPLAMPGAVKKSLSLMMQKNSPFYIKPRFDPTLWAWLVRFARNCNEKQMLRAGRARQALLNSSRRLYDELFAQEQLAAEFQTVGCLFVYQTQAEFDEFGHEAELLKREFGVQVDAWDARQLQEQEPSLTAGLAGGWYFESDAHLRPDRLMSSWRAKLESMGVVVRENRELQGFRPVNDGKAAAQFPDELVDADTFILATGALTPKLQRFLGCSIPIQPGKGYSITMARPQPCPTYPLLCPEHRLAVTPMQSGYRLGSTMEFSGYDSTLNKQRIAALREAARHYLLEPVAEPVEEEWYGWRPMTTDGLPIIDRSRNFANVWVVAGHNMLGLSMAPATGRLVAELIDGRETHIDPRPYRLERF